MNKKKPKNSLFLIGEAVRIDLETGSVQFSRKNDVDWENLSLFYDTFTKRLIKNDIKKEIGNVIFEINRLANRNTGTSILVFAEKLERLLKKKYET